MSWSTYTVGTADNIKDRVDAVEAPAAAIPARDEQLVAAKAAALAIIDSGVVGTGEPVTVAMSGHANPEHKPTAGFAPDCVTVSVAQTTTAAVELFDQQQALAAANAQ